MKEISDDCDIAEFIDHTLLNRDADDRDISILCEEAQQFGFKAVCVYPCHVARVADLLSGSRVRVASVAGFPTGLENTASKVDEVLMAAGDGATEIDMVLNSIALQSRDYQGVQRDIAAVVSAAWPCDVKVIIETAALDYELKIAACVLSKAAGAAFVKTSTGFGPGGANVEDVALLRRVVGDDMGVKASGGIKTRSQALAMLRAGATRLGSSSSVKLITG